MDMAGERRLPAARELVWAALNDPVVLQASIPGCRSLEAVGDGYKATASVKIGPVAANFAGNVRLLNLNPPESYRIEGAAQGGAAGFANGGADVALAAEGAETLLRYTVKATVGGKLAQLGARLIDASAKQMADQFFDNFAAQLGGTAVPDLAQEGPAGTRAPAFINPLRGVPGEFFGFPLIGWVAAAVFLYIFLQILSAYL